MSASPEAPSASPGREASAAGGRPFSWRFTTPLFLGSGLNPVNSSLISTALLPIARSHRHAPNAREAKWRHGQHFPTLSQRRSSAVLNLGGFY